MPNLISTPSIGALPRTAHSPVDGEFSVIIAAFESARAEGPTDLERFLPSVREALRIPILVELVRIDLEAGWISGTPSPLSDYRRRFPEAFEQTATRNDLAYEEYRLRAQAGLDPVAADYAKEYGASVSEWPPPREIRNATPGDLAIGKMDPERVAAVAREYQAFREQTRIDIEEWAKKPRGQNEATQLFRDLHQQNPEEALRLAEASARMPRAGSEFAGFKLHSELGRGAFGRVFLAEQTELADRPVALKVSADVQVEARMLAQLLHTNIVPIYSVHRVAPFQAVCMPFCGRMTLGSVLRTFRGETVPVSGKHLVTLLSSSLTVNDEPEASETQAGTKTGCSRAILELLERMSYVNAILWIGARVADGLSHAHDRGILHRDLKPANILLTDEGQPMLLDFNLSVDTKLNGLVAAARLGGTLPYMAPEHLQSFAGMPRLVDARADVYSLGVILFELLTGRHPFPLYSKGGQATLLRMISDRHQAPTLRNRNPEVSPAVESVVRKCLAFNPNERYQSARALVDDLERQLHDLPLQHAPNRSIRERMRKWARRHPRLSSATAIGLCAAVLLVSSASLAAYQHERRMGLEARETLGSFRDDSKRFQLSLTGLPEDDRRPLIEAAAAGRSALSRYPAPDNSEWPRARSVRHLSEADRNDLRVESGTLLLMLAHATTRASDDEAETREALRLNEQAESCFTSGSVPPVVWSQRADLLEKLNRHDEAKEYRRRSSAPATTARDLYLAGWEHARHEHYAAAVPYLERATRLDTQALWAWFLLGRSYDSLGRDADAIACYGSCLALQPDAHQVWFCRGLAYLRRGDFKNAQADFDRALELRPTLAVAYFHRGLARKELKDLKGAEEDLTAALDNGAHLTRVYFVRAQVRAQRSDAAGADRDRQEGMRREPVEESCWTARGFAKLGSDAKGALADFDKALERNPQYRPALINKAHVFGEILNRPADAVAVLDRAIQFHPEQAEFWRTRAVYYARLGRRNDAHRDAEQALQLNGDAATRYQVAGVYSLTSKENPDDRKEAFRLLAGALKKDYGFELLDIDPELAPIRDLPEFKNLVSAARALKIEGKR